MMRLTSRITRRGSPASSVQADNAIWLNGQHNA
jgi:hypothetical protein